MQHQHHFQPRAKLQNPRTPEDQRRDECVYRFQTDQVHVQNRNKKKKKTIIDLSFVMTTTEMWGGNLAPFIQTDLTHHVMLHQSQYF